MAQLAPNLAESCPFMTVDVLALQATTTKMKAAASRRTWNLTQVFPGVGYYLGTSSTPTSAAIATGTTIAGVAGAATLKPGDCIQDGAIGCVTTSSFKSADMAQATVGNIKSGIAIAGVAGQFPNATYPFSGASAAADLTSPTFNAQVKSSAAFEYWDSAGVRQTGAGDANIQATNIANGVTVFGTTGTLALPDPWDLRANTTVGGVTGKLPVNCRNTANTSVYDVRSPVVVSVSPPAAGSLPSPMWTTNDNTLFTQGEKVQLVAVPGQIPSSVGSAFNRNVYYIVYSVSQTSFSLATTAAPGTQLIVTALGGTAGPMQLIRMEGGTVDPWDTIDDYNASLTALPAQNPWPSIPVCGGIEVTAGDSWIWRDVTTSGTGAASCAGSPERCSYKDKASGIEWSKVQATGVSFATALQTCSALNTSGFNGHTDWRLPTEKEMLNAAEHGIKVLQSANFPLSLTASFWSSTSVSTSSFDTAYTINLMLGSSSGGASRDNPNNVVCVRP